MNNIIGLNNKTEIYSTASNYSTTDTKSTKPKLLKNFFLSKNQKYAKFITASNEADKTNQEISKLIKEIKDKYSIDKSIELIAINSTLPTNRRTSSWLVLCNDKKNSSSDCKLI
jgi:hypothetical protein